MSRRAIYFALILFVCAISAVAGISANNTGRANLPAPQNVTLSGMEEGIDVRWEAPTDDSWITAYQIAYQAMQRSGMADSWAYMWSSNTIHLIRHLAGGYEYRVYVRGCSETQCSEWAYGGTVWTESPRPVAFTPVPTPTPTPTATPTPTPVSTPTPRIVVVTVTPTPIPTPVPGILSCSIRRNGTIRNQTEWKTTGGIEVVSKVNKNIEAVFVNPSSDNWQYGIKTSESAMVRGGGKHKWLGLMFIVTADRELQVIEYPDFGYPRNGNDTNEILVYSTRVPELHIAPGARNVLTFMARTDTEPYRILVNGVEVPIENLPARWTDYWAFGREYLLINQYRRGWLIANQETDYEGLCTRTAN